MIYLFCGSDTDKVRTKAFEWVAKAREKEPNLAYIRLSREELSNEALQDAAASGGLFVKRLLILIDDPFQASRTTEADTEDGETAASALEGHINSLADSDNAIVILAPKLSAARAKTLSAKARVEYKYDKAAPREATRGFNSNLVNALASRSREKLWLEINRAFRAGDAPEMLHGLLHWKARDLIEKGGRGWGVRESRELSLRLIEILQASRRGGIDLGRALERLALSL